MDKPVSLQKGVLLPILLILLLNLLDWVMTMDEITLGIAHEGNPVVAYFVGASPLAALLFKTIVVGSGCLILFLLRKRSFTRIAVFFIMWCYVALMCWHVVIHLLP